MSDTNARELALTIITPQEKLFEGTCTAVTSVNDVGEFDILPSHENFITIVKKYVRVHNGADARKEFPISEAIIKAEQNKVYVFVGAEGSAQTSQEKVLENER